MSRPTACSAPASTARAARVASASASVALAALLALAVTACGSKAAPPTAATAGAGITIPALTTSLAAPGGTGWAVVEMGGSAAQYNNFWELFSRTAGGTWKLATPPGVASNGGLIAAVTGPGSLLTAFRPSQDLTFSPLALTPDGGAHWTEGNLVGAWARRRSRRAGRDARQAAGADPGRHGRDEHERGRRLDAAHDAAGTEPDGRRACVRPDQPDCGRLDAGRAAAGGR